MRISYWSSDVCSSDLDRDVRSEPRLANIECPVELLDRLSVGDHRADARLRIKSGDACAAGANALGQSALGIKLELELTREIEVCEQLVLTDIGGDHLADLAVVEARPKPESAGAPIVRVVRQNFFALAAQSLDQMRSEEHTSELQSLM